jgi:dienelactone hydrolase
MRSVLVFALAAALLAGCTVPRPPGEGSIRYRDAVFSSVTTETDITYGRAPDANGELVDLKLDLYQPAGDRAAKRPALVWVHGGGFTTGDKASGRARATFFARLGYVAVSINYRLLSPDGCGGNPNPTEVCRNAALAAQHDAQAAVRWLRANAAAYRVDTSRIAMAGSSAGGVTSVLAATHAEDPGTSGNPGLPSDIRAAVSVSGGVPTNELIDAGDSPTLFIHGTEDRVVPYRWAVQNALAMHTLGIFTVLHPIEGAAHGLPGEYGALINEQSSYFLWYAMDLDLRDQSSSAALPTSKDHCKNGGWRNYPRFKNQGDCVSFVATGGKNPPGKKP